MGVKAFSLQAQLSLPQELPPAPDSSAGVNGRTQVRAQLAREAVLVQNKMTQTFLKHPKYQGRSSPGHCYVRVLLQMLNLGGPGFFSCLAGE